MAYTLQEFCSEIHNILTAENNSAGREKVRQKLEQLLAVLEKIVGQQPQTQGEQG